MLVKLILYISSNCVLTVINASVAVTLLEQRPEKIQALSGIRTHDLGDAEHCTGIAEVMGSNPARSEPEFFQVSVQVVLRPHLH